MRRIIAAVLYWGSMLPAPAFAQALLGDASQTGTRPLAAPRRPVTLAVVGGARGGSEDAGTYGMLRLSVGLEELRPSPPADPAFEAESPAASERAELESYDARRATRVETTADALPQLASEAVSAALRAAGQSREMARLAGLVRRSRRGAYLPELRLQVGTRSDKALRMTPTLAEPGRFAQADSRDLWFETRVNWRLDRLVYSHDELAIEKLRDRAQVRRQALTTRVLKALKIWVRARLGEYDTAFIKDSPAHELLRAAHAAAELDVLTGGWFSLRAAQLGYAISAAGRRQTAHHSTVAPPVTER